MDRKDLAFGGTVIGGLLLVAGVLNLVATWIFLVAGAVVGVAGLSALGARGAVGLMMMGGWLIASSFLDWALGQWNLFVSGLLVTALGMLAGAAGSPPPAHSEPEGAG